MAVCSIAVTLDTRSEEQEMEWFALVTFGKLAESLLKHRKGDMISTAGKVQPNTWTTGGGDDRRQFQIVADSVISARTVRPGGDRKANQGQGITHAHSGAQSFQEPAPFNDPIRF